MPIRFNPIKGMKFSHNGNLFEITGVWFNAVKPVTVVFIERSSGRVFEKPADEIIEKLYDGSLKYEGL